MRRFLKVTVGLLVALAAILLAVCVAQDDPNDVPLGDVARNLRKKAPPVQNVIDDDNLSQVMVQAETRHAAGANLKFLMAGESKSFQVSAPEVTCSLSFSANTKALLSNQYAQMDLPAADIPKLKGHATIEGDALTVPVANGTDWHVSEVAVALTIVKKNATAEETPFGAQNSLPTPSSLAGSEVRPERKPDVTVIYRMRAAAAPFSTTVFSAPLNLDLEAGDEWHWAIVQAKGYPPQSYSSDQTAAQNQSGSVLLEPAPASLLPADSPASPASSSSPLSSSSSLSSAPR